MASGINCKKGKFLFGKRLGKVTTRRVRVGETKLVRYGQVLRQLYLKFVEISTGRPRYMRDRERKIFFTLNEFAYKETKDDYKLEDRFHKKG